MHPPACQASAQRSRTVFQQWQQQRPSSHSSILEGGQPRTLREENNINQKLAHIWANGGHAQTNASPMVEEKADMKRTTDVTSERMLLGNFIKAHSNPVIDTKISLMAIRMWLCSTDLCSVVCDRVRDRVDLRATLDPDIEWGHESLTNAVLAHQCSDTTVAGLRWPAWAHA